ncbi:MULTISPECIES: agmatine deiminase family protein [Calditerrivibrio]|uniref:Agmatine deiminase n=1 Tax=Calditerrivibrio nitroreducens TaxID=477976 RepID=A0A2J6WHW7_9BACT|nr:MAG: agmatine deiminase [Calditerrivibrio nitroreducens]
MNILPAEWHKQDCVQLTWPHEDTDWRGYLDEVDNCFYNIAKEIVKREKLIIVCKNIERVRKITSGLDQSRIIYCQIENNDTWARDHGGITVFRDGKPTILNYRFNGWGLKFPSNYDNQITRKLFERGIFNKNTKIEYHKDFVLEGGSIESDGEGTILTTSRCLMSYNRNEHLDSKEIEKRLKKDLGAERIIFLEHGYLEGDDTDSHIDTLARFCSVDTICYVKCDDSNDPHYYELSMMEEELKSLKDKNGNYYNLIPLPMVDPVYYENERLPATYANFLIINDAVLVPIYNCSKDGVALEIFKDIFKEREVVAVDCSVLIRQHGSLHCVTMQYPEGVLEWEE